MYLLVILMGILAMIASGVVRHNFNKYSKVQNYRRMTGKEAAERMLAANGIRDVSVMRVSGNLTDNYNPKTMTVNLSENVYDKTSVSALAVACHEVGHAIQHNQNYLPLKFRSSLVPVAQLGSGAGMPLFFIGFILSLKPLLWLGIVFFSASVLFHVVTLPVEFNASARALDQMVSMQLLGDGEMAGARKVLGAAAMTYVASTAVSLAHLIRLIWLAGGRD